MQTVIHCIPDEVKTLNITTGFPLKQTPIASMVMQLLALQLEGYSQSEQGYRLRYLSRVLRHPYGKYLISEAERLIEKIKEEKEFLY